MLSNKTAQISQKFALSVTLFSIELIVTVSSVSVISLNGITKLSATLFTQAQLP